MASRRPPLFELLQQDDDQRPGRGTSGALGPKAQNGHAQGSVERKPTAPPNSAEAASLKAAKAAVVEDPQPVTRPPEPAPAPKAEPKTQPKVQPKVQRGPEAKPTRRPEARPEARPETKPETKAERVGQAADWSAMHPQRAVRLRLLWLYVGVYVFVAVVAGVWGLAYQLGKNDERNRLPGWLTEGAQEPGPITDPLVAGSLPEGEGPAEPIVERPPVEREARPESARNEARKQDPSPVPPAPKVNVLTDARLPGNNYLKLASGMTLDRAKALAEHLTDNGVPAMALDEGRQGFGLYTAFAVPSGQFRTMSEARRAHEARVIALLGTAPTEAGGPYTPRDQLWMRFDG